MLNSELDTESQKKTKQRKQVAVSKKNFKKSRCCNDGDAAAVAGELQSHTEEVSTLPHPRQRKHRPRRYKRQRPCSRFTTTTLTCARALLNAELGSVPIARVVRGRNPLADIVQPADPATTSHEGQRHRSASNVDSAAAAATTTGVDNDPEVLRPLAPRRLQSQQPQQQRRAQHLR